MKNLSPEILEQIREAIKRPEGTVEFTYIFEEDLFSPNIPGGIIFHLVSGGHYFRLERTDNLEVSFYHSSPGTGTRVATIDLRKLKPSSKVFFAFTWSPKEIQLYVGPKIDGGELVSAIGVPSEIGYRVGEDGSVSQVGSPGVQVMGTRINVEGKQMVKPTAIDAWKETKKAIEILLTGESKEGYIFEVVKSNLSIVMMVTGFEAYCKTRFDEIEKEGVQADHEKIAHKLKETKENYQDFDGYCKDVYKYGFGILFSNLVKMNEFSRLKQLFSFRSRIVHASPLITMVNEFKVPAEEPLFSSNIVKDALDLFDKFISNLHKATLKLKRKD
jgi:hypothetical protein